MVSVLVSPVRCTVASRACQARGVRLTVTRSGAVWPRPVVTVSWPLSVTGPFVGGICLNLSLGQYGGTEPVDRGSVAIDVLVSVRSRTVWLAHVSLLAEVIDADCHRLRAVLGLATTRISLRGSATYVKDSRHTSACCDEDTDQTVFS